MFRVLQLPSLSCVALHGECARTGGSRARQMCGQLRLPAKPWPRDRGERVGACLRTYAYGDRPVRSERPRQCVRLSLRSVAAELLTANIIIVDSGIVQHAADTCYHCRRPGHIIDGTGSVTIWRGNTVQMPDEHLSADPPGLAMPGWRWVIHRGNKSNIRIVLVDGFEFLQKSGALRALVGIKKKYPVWQLLMRYPADHTAKGRDPDAAGNQDRRPARVVV